MKRYLLTIAYDGTRYYGWQKQKDPKLMTVESVLEKALRKLFKDPTLECMGASRTDKGVHALGQRVTIDVSSSIPAKRVPYAIREYLPDDVIVLEGVEVTFDFHPRYDCIKKIYEYKIHNAIQKNPLFFHYAEFVRRELDIIQMEEAAKFFVGTYDFESFCAKGSTVKSMVRTIFDCSVKKEGDFVYINVSGDGFLYNMIRIIAGTLIYVGLGKIEAKNIPDIISQKQRELAGITARAEGLMLVKIEYDTKKKFIDTEQ